MAGLLGDNFGYTDPGVGLAAGLLAGRGNLGANLSAGLLSGQQGAQANRQFALVQQNAERANRANDLQQVGVLYKMALQRDALQQAQDEDAGKPHIQDPMLGVLQQKMAELAGLPPLSSGAQAVPMPQSQAPSAQPSPFQYGSDPSLNQPPVGQNFKGANPDYQPLPMPTSQVGQLPTPIPNASSQPPQPSQYQPQAQNDVAAQLARYRRQGDAFAFAGLDPIAQNRYKLGIPTVSRGVSFNPSNGLPIAGFVDNVPVRFQNGQPQVIQSDIPQAIAQRAGAVAGAQAAATSPYKTEMVTDASGRTVPKFLPQLPGYPGGQTNAAPQPAIPPAVQAAADRGSPFVATQAPGGPVQFQQSPQGAQAPKDPWDTVPVVPQATGMGQSTQDKEMAVQRALTAKELSQEMGNVATANAQRVATNTQALDLVNKADTGYFAHNLSDFRNLLASLAPSGSDLAKHAADQAATDQVLAKDLVNTALQKGKQLFGSRFTQSEVGIMLSRANPSPEMQKAAIKFLLETDNAMSQYGIQQGLDFGKYLAKGGDPLLYKSWYATAMPMSDALKSVHLGNQVQTNQGRPPLSSFEK